MSMLEDGNAPGGLSRQSVFISHGSDCKLVEELRQAFRVPTDSIMDALHFGLSLPRANKIMQAVGDCSDAEMFEYGGRIEAIIQRGGQTLLYLSDQNECKFLWRHMQRCRSLLPTRWVHT